MANLVEKMKRRRPILPETFEEVRKMRFRPIRSKKRQKEINKMIRQQASATGDALRGQIEILYAAEFAIPFPNGLASLLSYVPVLKSAHFRLKWHPLHAQNSMNRHTAWVWEAMQNHFQRRVNPGNTLGRNAYASTSAENLEMVQFFNKNVESVLYVVYRWIDRPKEYEHKLGKEKGGAMCVFVYNDNKNHQGMIPGKIGSCMHNLEDFSLSALIFAHYLGKEYEFIGGDPVRMDGRMSKETYQDYVKREHERQGRSHRSFAFAKQTFASDSNSIIDTFPALYPLLNLWGWRKIRLVDHTEMFQEYTKRRAT